MISIYNSCTVVNEARYIVLAAVIVEGRLQVYIQTASQSPSVVFEHTTARGRLCEVNGINHEATEATDHNVHGNMYGERSQVITPLALSAVLGKLCTQL